MSQQTEDFISACKRAMQYGDYSYHIIRIILEKGYDQIIPVDEPPSIEVLLLVEVEWDDCNLDKNLFMRLTGYIYIDHYFVRRVQFLCYL